MSKEFLHERDSKRSRTEQVEDGKKAQGRMIQLALSRTNQAPFCQDFRGVNEASLNCLPKEL